MNLRKTGLILLIIISIFTFYLSSCKPLYDSPVDPESPEYQGYETVNSVNDIKLMDVGESFFYPMLIITESKNAINYQIEITTNDDSFSSPLYSKISNQNSMKINDANLYSGKYYWRARAQRPDNSWGKWTDASTFTLMNINVNSPQDNSTISDTTPTISWSAVQETVGYEIQISETQYSIEGTTIVETSSNEYVIESPLPNNNTYHWRVRGISNDNKTSWSSINSFGVFWGEISGINSDSYMYLSDANNTITWDEVIDVDHYEIQFSEIENSFTSELTAISAENSYDIDQVFSNEGKIFWRIRAVDSDSQTGEWTMSYSSYWLKPHKISPSNGNIGDQFAAWQNTIAIDGEYMAIGSPESDYSGEENAGAVYIYHRALDGTWGNETILTASDAQANDRFGESVDICGDYLVIGANSAEVDGYAGAGAVYVYYRTGINTWENETKLTCQDPSQSSYLGLSVGISGDYIIAGAMLKTVNTIIHAGAVYIFHRTGLNSWTDEAKIISPEETIERDELFGNDVAISGNSAIIANGSSGQAYIYNRVGLNNWELSLRFSPSTGRFFDVDISDRYATCGTADSVYVLYEESANNWNNTSTLELSGLPDFEYFGPNVSISGERIIVGSSTLDQNGYIDAGSVHLFHRIGTNEWSNGTLILSPDIHGEENFGRSIDISADTIIVGSNQNSDWQNDLGALFYFPFM